MTGVIPRAWSWGWHTLAWIVGPDAASTDTGPTLRRLVESGVLEMTARPPAERDKVDPHGPLCLYRLAPGVDVEHARRVVQALRLSRTA